MKVFEEHEIWDAYLVWCEAHLEVDGLRRMSFFSTITGADPYQWGATTVSNVHANRLRAMLGPHGKTMCKVLALKHEML